MVVSVSYTATDFAVKIFYGICGEGMGHAGRSIALIERLAALGHHVTIFTFDDGFRLLTESGFLLQRIAGLRFRESPHGGVDRMGTVVDFYRYWKRRHQSIDFIRQLALVERPDLFVTDFEPLTAIVAASLKVPCVSLDNQHKFCQPLETDFPLYLQLYSRAAGAFIRRWIKSPSLCIVSVFHHCQPNIAM